MSRKRKYSLFDVTPEMEQLLVQSADNNRVVAQRAMAEIARAVEIPIRQGILSGDITDGIFTPIQLRPGATPEFPLDPLAPGTEKDYVAFTMPNNGYIPERRAEADTVMVQTYDIAGSIDWSLNYARDARWDVVQRHLEILRGQFVKKTNDDAWHTIIAAGVDRNILVFDPDAANEQFTKRLVSLMMVTMRRNGGGNSASNRRSRLTDLYLSPEAVEDIRNWGVDQVDDITRRELITQEDGLLARIFRVNLHDLDELGKGQEYQLFYENDLGGTLPAGDAEIVVGLDLSREDSFVMPIREGVQIFEDMALHRRKLAGFYGWATHGVAVLDNRRVLLGSF